MKKKSLDNQKDNTESPRQASSHDFVEKKLASDELKQPASFDEPLVSAKKKKTKQKIKKKVHVLSDMPAVDLIPGPSKEKEAKIMKQLTQIYENPDGSMPDMAEFKTRRHSGIFRAIIITGILGLLLLTGSYVYALFLAPKVLFSQDDVLFTVSGDEVAEIGEVVQYRIRIKNAQEAKLLNARVELHYPSGFVFEEASIAPMTSTTNMWQLGDIIESGSEHIDIRGRLFGNVDEEQSLRAFLRYQPSNFSSEFQKVKNLTTSLTNPTFTLDLSAPEFLSAGAAGEMVISLEPKESHVAEHLQVVVDAGPHFVKQKSDPVSNELGPLSWNIDRLTEGSDIILHGVFSDEVADSSQPMTVRVLGWSTAERIGEGYVYAEVAKDVAIKKTDLTGQVILNGSQGNTVVQPGEKMNVSVVIKNTGSITLSNIEATLAFDMPALEKNSVLDWSKIMDDADGTIVGKPLEEGMRRGSITWTSVQKSGLKSLKPGDELVFDVVLPVKTDEQIDLTELAKYKGQLILEAIYGKEGEKKTFTSVPIDVTINSDLALEVQDDMTEVTGGELHTITWLLSNTFHELKDVTLTTQLFGDVTLEEDNITAPAGNVVYNKEEKKLIWKIDTIPLSVDVLALQFPVLINKKNPTQKNLTSKVEIIATDTVTGEKIVEIGDEVLLLAQ